MRKQRSLLGAAALAAVLVLALVAAETIIVKIQTTQLRRNPQFFSPGFASLKAGERI